MMIVLEECTVAYPLVNRFPCNVYVSTMIPRKVSEVDGPSNFLAAKGIPSSSHTCVNVLR